MSTASHHDQPANGSPQPPPTTGGHILSAALAIALIYLASAAALWFLSMIGPISATVNGVIEKSGGSIWFAAGGVVAAFAIILVLGLIALYSIVKIMYRVVPPVARLITASIISLARFAAHL
jgi:hypothetical protein